MLPVPTLLAILHVHVTLDMKEMDSCAQVCCLLEICLNINNNIKRYNWILNKILTQFFRHR